MVMRNGIRSRIAAAGIVMTMAAGVGHAWPGFNWDDWRSITGVAKPDVVTPQSGHAALLPLLRVNFESDATITAAADWEAKRDRIKLALGAMLGAPANLERPKPGATELGREDLGAYERIHLRIASEPDDTIPAYWLKPKGLRDGKHPIVIVLHQTQAPGKAESCGMTGDPNMAFAKELAERGMMCIAPDAIGFGERIGPEGQPYDGALDFYRKHPQWSFFGKMVWDVSRVIDYLETQPEVDAERIGVIGHSHGAYGSIMASVFEPRIKATVASCGFTTLRTDPNPNRWSHLTALMPRLGYYVDDIKQAPFDWHEIAACLAPRPYFNWATLNDDIFPETANLAQVYAQLTEVYALYGKSENVVGRLEPGAHRFPPEVRQEAYAFLERHLRGASAE